MILSTLDARIIVTLCFKVCRSFSSITMPDFCPQDTILTLDYPILKSINQQSGIDAIEVYVKSIGLEQTFFRAMDEEVVCSMLRDYDANFQKQYYNICFALLKQMAWVSLPQVDLSEEVLSRWLNGLVDQRYHGDNELRSYLLEKSKEFYYEVLHKLV
jgi:hypothetical protein